MANITGNRGARVENLTPWRKGQSGNPNGRPKKVQTLATVAEDNGERALKKIVKLIDSADDRVALAAAQHILDRALGKPKQAVDVSQKKEAADYSTAELLAIARMGRAGNTAPGSGENEPDGIRALHISAIQARRPS